MEQHARHTNERLHFSILKSHLHKNVNDNKNYCSQNSPKKIQLKVCFFKNPKIKFGFTEWLYLITVQSTIEFTCVEWRFYWRSWRFEIKWSRHQNAIKNTVSPCFLFFIKTHFSKKKLLTQRFRIFRIPHLISYMFRALPHPEFHILFNFLYVDTCLSHRSFDVSVMRIAMLAHELKNNKIIENIFLIFAEFHLKLNIVLYMYLFQKIFKPHERQRSSVE